MNTLFWLIKHYIRAERRFLRSDGVAGVIGMSLAVACLVVTMAVVSGYISTLQRSIQDAFGHLIVTKRGIGDAEAIVNEMKPTCSSLVARTPFLMVEAIVAAKGN